MTPQSTRLAWGFTALAVATYALIVLGSMVRAHGAGLACPDWPLCFGQLVPVFDMRVAFEWGHRALAGSVSLGLFALTLGVWRSPVRKAIAGPLSLGWALLLLQVILGGLTVILKLAPWTVTAHLLIGNCFCLTLLWLARDLFELNAAPRRERLSTVVRVGVAFCAGLLGLQLLLGGWVASHAAGLACSDFPTCDGKSLVPTLSGLVGLHVIHRLTGYGLLVSFAVLAWLTRHLPRVAILTRGGLRLLLLQVLVGAANVLFLLPVEITALHSALAAALVLVTGLVVRETVRTGKLPEPAAGREALEVG